MDSGGNLQRFELDFEGVCTACIKTAVDAEYLTCASCKSNFHAICAASNNEEKWASKTMINLYKSSSTKENFKFYCNSCLTHKETNEAGIDKLRVKLLEDNMKLIMKELVEIKSTLALKSDSTIVNASASQKNPWFTDKVTTTTIMPPSETVLVLDKAGDYKIEDLNKKAVEKIIIENQKDVKKSFINTKGSLVVVCEDSKKSDFLK